MANYYEISNYVLYFTEKKIKPIRDFNSFYPTEFSHPILP